LLVPSQAGGQEQKEWTWKDRQRKTRTRAELDQILAEHKLWLESRQSRGTQADLSGADLRDADLIGAQLSGADLDGAYLIGAQLNGADLSGADLSDAYLIGGRLSGADLNGAKLKGVELKDAYFSDADLRGMIFEPMSNPQIRTIARAEHLEFMTYENSPDALVQLRKQFQDSGFRTQERRITYALSRRKAQLDGPVERWFQRFAFDLTCQYGMNPGRSLQIWLALLLFCWLVYAVFIHVPGNSGIYRIQKTGGVTAKEEIEEQIRPPTISLRPPWPYPLRLIHRELRVLFWAGFFSLMSAFNICFRDINFGRWLRLLPRTEYDLRAKGLARTVAGFQSLISVYLIALWVLTYFGRPFQ
jgi:pentapeptide repeat protein